MLSLTTLLLLLLLWLLLLLLFWTTLGVGDFDFNAGGSTAGDDELSFLDLTTGVAGEGLRLGVLECFGCFWTNCATTASTSEPTR